MVTKTRERLNDFAYGSKRPIRKQYSKDAIEFQVHGIDDLLSVTLSRDDNPELYDVFANRKNIDVKLDKDKYYEPAEIQKMKKKLLSGYDMVSKDEYDAGFEKLKQAKEAQTHNIYMGDLARQLTYDLADAYNEDKSGKRYAAVVKYAKEVLGTIGKGDSYEDIKEPGRGVFGKMMDKIYGRDSLRSTKKLLHDFFDKDHLRRHRKDFTEMAKNIPNEPMKSRVMGVKGDPAVNKFMDIYNEKSIAAAQAFDVSSVEFAEVMARREIAEAAERTFDVKIKAHNDKIQKEQKNAEDKKINEEKRKETRKAKAKAGKETQYKKKMHEIISARG